MIAVIFPTGVIVKFEYAAEFRSAPARAGTPVTEIYSRTKDGVAVEVKAEVVSADAIFVSQEVNFEVSKR